MLEVKQIAYRIGTESILDDVSAVFPPGEVTMIIGPNGSGKSTLLKIISHEIKSYKGTIAYNGRVVNKNEQHGLAKIRAVLSQHSELTFPLSVEEVVMMGRYPHFGLQPGLQDQEILNKALDKMGIAHLRFRNYLTLSGGEKQKTHFARVLAQIWDEPRSGCRFLFLDEPIASMDLNYQHEFLRITRDLAASNIVVVAIIHDLNLALQYADKIVALNKGKVIAYDTPDKVITPALIREMYSIDSRILHSDQFRFPLLIAGE